MAGIRSATVERDVADARPDRVRFAPKGEFQTVLQARVGALIAGHRSGDDGTLFAQMVLVGAWFYASYAVLVFVALPFWAVPLVVASMGFATAGVMMNVVHDAAHRAASRRQWLNDTVGWLLAGGLGISPDWWQAKHNNLHHVYTNIAGVDDDIDIGSVIRVTPDQPWKPWHPYQHIYAFMLSPMMFLSMMLAGDSRFIFRGRVGHRQVEQPTFGRAVWLLFRKLAGITLLLGVAFLMQPALAVIAATVFAGLIAGATVSIIFQVQHVVEGTVYPQRNPETNAVDAEWAVVQAESSADFGLNSRFLTWYSGALNYHIEHHLFPRISHTRLPELKSIVRATCAEFGVRQLEFPTLRAAVRSHAHFLRRMGRRPEPALEVSA